MRAEIVKYPNEAFFLQKTGWITLEISKGGREIVEKSYDSSAKEVDSCTVIRDIAVPAKGAGTGEEKHEAAK